MGKELQISYISLGAERVFPCSRACTAPARAPSVSFREEDGGSVARRHCGVVMVWLTLSGENVVGIILRCESNINFLGSK